MIKGRRTSKKRKPLREIWNVAFELRNQMVLMVQLGDEWSWFTGGDVRSLLKTVEGPLDESEGLVRLS